MNYQTHAEHSAEGIILHRDGIIIDMDEATASIFGYERGELIGRVLAELIPDYEKYAGPHPSALPEEPPLLRPAPALRSGHAPGQNSDAKKTVALGKCGTAFEVAIDRKTQG